MVWGFMGWNGVGILTEIEGRMDAKQYVEILEGGVMESVEKLGMDNVRATLIPKDKATPTEPQQGEL